MARQINVLSYVNISGKYAEKIVTMELFPKEFINS